MAAITIEHEVTYAYPPDTVYAALTDVDLQPKWQANLLRVWHEPEGPVEAGTVIGTERKIMGKPTTQLTTVTVIEPPFRLEMREKPGADQQPLHVAYRLTPVNGGSTRLEFRMVIQGVPAVFAPAVKRRLKSETSTQFEVFRNLLGG